MNRIRNPRPVEYGRMLSVAKRERKTEVTLSELRADLRSVGVRVIRNGESIRSVARSLGYSEDFVTTLLCAYVWRESEAVSECQGGGALQELGFAV